MKTIKDFEKEILGNSELKKEFIAIDSDTKMSSFLKEHDCDFSLEEVKEFLKREEEIHDDELNDVTGGTCYDDEGRPIVTEFNSCDLMEDIEGNKTDGYCKDCKYCDSRSGPFTSFCWHPKRHYN